ncbi:O-antigen ligase family protein [Aurantimonas sp. Leaf443]|uniref:O-antigen ligase family protein n=1 Tax=Aurantimonas sp. Leaf443 TaxID=1736378 RepID=UPI0006F46867|nr:O-antigen ligase family protein [Aurantimonas sp. Leaf443]KQT88369.1 hypothetical protein ASG48_02805 [Aurantimonas sp. Leaf443]
MPHDGAPQAEERRFADRYFAVLLFALAAYAFTGKGFAYAGVPPLFPAEMILAAGLVTLVWPRPSGAVLYSVPHLLLAMLIALVVVRTVPYVGPYGIDALRDSVIVVYGLFAFIVANLILQKPERIALALRRAAPFFTVYGFLSAFLYTVPKALDGVIPQWPGSGAPMMQLRGGEVATHLGAAIVFSILGLRRSSLLWMAFAFAGFVAISAQSRGGMLAILVPAVLCMALSGRIRPAVYACLFVLPVVSVLYAVDLEIPLGSDYRTVRVGQLIDNSLSIVGSSGDEMLDGTKKWRLQWWDKIIAYTVYGEGYWTGRGFGINLAAVDGFAGTGRFDGPPLRSPHNAHMTILARTGVPGLVLWLTLLAAWLSTMLGAIWRSRMNGDVEWNSAFVFVTCYLVGALVNSTFDVALEGPMIGVIFWVLFGAGTGMAMTYAALCRDRLAETRAAGLAALAAPARTGLAGR